MEIRARYTLIGLFSLAVIAAGFGFVYWLNNAGGLGQRDVYRIKYDSPVSGLLKGSPVLFNGIRIGEVTGLQLDPASPSDVTVLIAVEHGSPIRGDTHVGLEFQGLTGTPVVALSGGSPTLPLLSSAKGEVPILVAEKDAGLSMTETARGVLRRIDAVVSDNAVPVRNLIANVDKFAGALARNSDRVDGIIAGLERFTGGAAKPSPAIFGLAAAQGFSNIRKRPTGQLQVGEPTALNPFDSEKILIRRSGDAVAVPLDNAQWPDTIPKVVQSRLLQSFENAQYMRALAQTLDGVRGDFQLLTDIRAFQINAGAEATADVELTAKILSSAGRIVDARVFHATVPVASLNPEAAAGALSDAFQKVASDIVLWTFAVI